MGKYEVTIKQYLAFLRSGGDKTGFPLGEENCQLKRTGQGFSLSGSRFGHNENQPMAVSWDVAQKFCEWLSKQTGLTMRLPTEAEWEYACRAGTTTRYYMGDNESDLARAGWYRENSGCKTHPTGEKKPNNFGLYDMHGNIWEWCEDWYAENYYNRNPTIDPPGPRSGKFRVLRGGACGHGKLVCRSASRSWDMQGSQSKYLGFRVVILSNH